ncbi:MAG: Xaa-Pro peptidase family protein [Candidatus Thorarchaeota archaeon]|nr:Xaa-Pro peptidase family protein [Candidatus Thorarchaeota archaeon]
MLEDIDRLMELEEVDGLLAFGNAFENPDIFWLTGFRSLDDISFLHNRGEESLVATSFHALERVTKESFIKRTHDLTEVVRSLMKEGRRASDFPEILLKNMLNAEFSGEVLGVPDHFPASRLVAVQNLGYKVKVVPDLLKDARATKSADEINLIEKAGKATIGAISQVIEMIRDADIGANDILLYNKKPLTVKDVKLALDHFLLDHGAESAEDAILAVGEKGFDWHYLGLPEDKLKAGVPIIMDVFPRLKQEFYVADVTRTVVKGKPDDKVKQMFDAVLAAGDAVFDAMTDGANIDEVNLECYNTFKKHGFDSSRLNPSAVEGMTHGLGHGIGLAIHENPSLYKRDACYEDGHVVAIEPGVYLKAHGGVRMENDFVVTKGKPRRTTLGLDDAMYL